MIDEDKTKAQLMRELDELRQFVSELEAFKAEHDRARKALGESEYRYRSLVELSPEAIFVHQEGIILYINPAGIKIFGASDSNELLHKSLFELVHPDYHDTVKNRLRGIYEKQKTLNRADLKFIRLDNREIDVEATGTYITYSGKPAGLSIVRDVTERKQSEIALKKSEKRYRQLVETMNEGLGLADQNYIFTYVNPRFCEMLGYDRDDIVGRKLIDFVHDDYKELMSEQIERRKKGEEERFEIAWRTKGGDTIFTSASPKALHDDNGRFIGSMGILMDITNQRTLEQQLQLSQKMEAVGTLAGGVAHDFNNLLMAIQGRTSLMMLEADRFHPSFEHLREIENCIQKAAKLTKQLLGFARGGKYEIRPTDLNDLIENSAQMFGRTKKEITIYKKYEERLWPAAIDRSQIDQVLLNIFVNAWQAMPEGGDLFIRTKNEILDQNFVQAYGAAPGKYIKITIMDTGTGMDDKTMKRVFDPFFTTKKKQRGTGLGLASAYGIIKNHDGIITVESAKDKGATFHLYLPASEGAVIEQQRYEQKISVGSETVLLVDDETMIIDVSVQMLKRLGYEVLTAHNGRQAIEIFQQNHEKIAIVVLDLIMPGMGGGEVYERLKEIDSDVKVLLSSGYSINGQAAEILNHGCDGFIQKPFNLNELSYKLREIIS